LEQTGNLIGRLAIKAAEDKATLIREGQRSHPGICSVLSANEQSPFFEAPQNPAEVAGIQIERRSQLAGRRSGSMGHFKEYAYVRKRQRTPQVTLRKDADPLCVAAIESANRLDASSGVGTP
jgi:hypothetical protein